MQQQLLQAAGVAACGPEVHAVAAAAVHAALLLVLLQLQLQLMKTLGRSPR
jgi:hypothetical protein